MTTGHVHVLQPSNINYVRMVDITGVDGTLTAIGVASGKNYHYFRITIDGSVVADDLLTGSNATVAAANNGLGVALPFDHSLLVEVRDAPSPSALTKYWAAWVTSHTETIGEGELRVEEFAGQPFLVRHVDYGEDGHVRYSVETTEQPLLWSRVDLETDFYAPDESIDGTVTVWQGPSQEPVFLDQVELIIRPYGFTRVLDSRSVAIGDNVARFTFSDLQPLVHGRLFEIVADLSGFANIPALFYRV